MVMSSLYWWEFFELMVLQRDPLSSRQWCRVSRDSCEYICGFVQSDLESIEIPWFNMNNGRIILNGRSFNFTDHVQQVPTPYET